jgi:outer membrane protein TolC
VVNNSRENARSATAQQSAQQPAAIAPSPSIMHDESPGAVPQTANRAAIAFASTTNTRNSPEVATSPEPSATLVRLLPPTSPQPATQPLPPPTVDAESTATPAATADSATAQGNQQSLQVVPAALYPVDLPTALQLANADNCQVALAREQIRQAWAQAQAARVLWLPSIRAGVDYNKHEGQIQDVAGNIFPTSRGNFYGGLGALVPGAASPALPGIYANFRLADAVFQPLAARQAATARQFAAAAATNDVLLQVSLAYLELMRASSEMAIAQQSRNNAQQLADLTASYARSGQGLQADADRAMAELSVRKNDTIRAQESIAVASARLAQLLRLDPTVALDPVEPSVFPIDLSPPCAHVGELVAQGLTARPELAQNRALVAQAVARMQRERYAVFMPSVLLGASYGAFGGGLGGSISNIGNRMDADIVAYWELRNMGFGEQAARAETRSLARQADVNRLLAMDIVAREVVEAHAQVTARRQQIAVAQEGLAAAAASHQHNLERIAHAQGLPLEALQSNQALAQLQREYLRSVTDYNIAQFTLYRALGWPGNSLQTALASRPGS